MKMAWTIGQWNLTVDCEGGEKAEVSHSSQGKPHIHLYSSQRHVNVNLQPCRVCQQQHSHVLTVCISYRFLIFAQDPRWFFSLWAVTLLSRCCHAASWRCASLFRSASRKLSMRRLHRGDRDRTVKFFCVRQTWSGEKRWKRIKLLQNRHDDIFNDVWCYTLYVIYSIQQ